MADGREARGECENPATQQEQKKSEPHDDTAIVLQSATRSRRIRTKGRGQGDADEGKAHTVPSIPPHRTHKAGFLELFTMCLLDGRHISSRAYSTSW
jgi:hypothetical protein